MNAASRRAYALVGERSFGLCESRGAHAAEQKHHRLHRSHGGGESAVNILDLCRACHELAHQASDRYVIGVSVRSGKGPEHEPANRPVLYRGRWAFLLPDGGLKDMEEVQF